MESEQQEACSSIPRIPGQLTWPLCIQNSDENFRGTSVNTTIRWNKFNIISIFISFPRCTVSSFLGFLETKLDRSKISVIVFIPSHWWVVNSWRLVRTAVGNVRPYMGVGMWDVRHMSDDERERIDKMSDDEGERIDRSLWI